MDYKRLGAILFIITSTSVLAQNSIDQAIDSVRQNNKTIISAKQYVVARGLEYHSGITLENPSLSADYMIGRPVAGGNQVDFLAVQGFDFPTTYFKKGELADQRSELLNIGLRELEQNLFLDVKLLGLQMISLNRQKLVLEKRKVNSELIVADYQKKFDLEEINALDLNKAKIQLLRIKSGLRLIESQILIKTQHLTELNGGSPLTIVDTLYPISPLVPLFETLEVSIEAVDPRLKWLDQQKIIYQSQVDVSKAMALPKFEAGYHYQSVLGQTFNGVHVGMTIPLWQSKNTVKASKANVQYGSLQLDEHRVDHYFEIKELYEQYENLKRTLEEYRVALEGLNSEELLSISLELEEINFITYSMELQYYYATYDRYAQMELEYHLILAELFKYQL